MSELNKQMQSLGKIVKAYHRYSVHADDKWKKLDFPCVKKSLKRVEELTNVRAIKSLLNPVDLERLRDKVQKIYTGRLKEELTRRECRNLPFILLSEKNSLSLTKFIMRKIDLEKTLTFRSVLFSYFNKFKTNDSKIEFLQSELQSWISIDSQALKRNVFLKRSPFLLANNGTKELGNLFIKYGVVQALQQIDFPSNLFASQFVKMAVQEAFRLEASMETKLERFVEVVKNPLYKGQTPYIIGPLIIGAAKAGDASIIAKLMDLIFKVMGDPRNNASWIHVEDEAIKIYYKWMVKNDFAVFFALIERTASVTADGERMWRERKAFWNAYLNEISMSRIVLGSDARQMAQNLQKKLTNYDILKGKSADSCLLVFQMRGYTFIESSHNGSLRIYPKEKEPIDFFFAGHKIIRYSDITQLRTMEQFVHRNMWQFKVHDWIVKNCGIWRDAKQMGVQW